MYIETV